MYTSHGLQIPGTDVEDELPIRIACGGFEFCEVCANDFLDTKGLTWQEWLLSESLKEETLMTLDETPKEAVNHPDHYNDHPSGVECIDIVRHMNFNLGNAVKYIWRAGLKDSAPTIQDLEKAKWYLEDEIELRKKDI